MLCCVKNFVVLVGFYCIMVEKCGLLGNIG